MFVLCGSVTFSVLALVEDLWKQIHWLRLQRLELGLLPPGVIFVDTVELFINASFGHDTQWWWLDNNGNNIEY